MVKPCSRITPALASFDIISSGEYSICSASSFNWFTSANALTLGIGQSDSKEMTALYVLIFDWICLVEIWSFEKLTSVASQVIS
ncbi:hypothetical protein D3C77_602480 [compost metagenome]